jgi:hypothetical protein
MTQGKAKQKSPFVTQLSVPGITLVELICLFSRTSFRSLKEII